MGYLTDADFEELPENDHDAFVKLEAISRSRMHREDADQHGNFTYNAAMRYMNEVTALAEQFGFSGIGYKDDIDDHHQEYNRFTRAVEFQVAQIRVQRARRLRRLSVEITGANRERMQRLIERLRAEVQNADIPEKRKRSLLDRIAEFEAELTKKRVDMAKAMMVIALTAAAMNDFAGVLQSGPEIVNSISRWLGADQAREEDIQHLMPKPQELKSLEDMRPRDELKPINPEIEDDIPF